MEPSLAIREFLDYVVVNLITRPEDAGVSHEERDGRHFFRIRLHPDDAGRVIGRNGKTIGAIRSLVLASAEKHGLRVNVDIEDPLEARAGRPDEQEFAVTISSKSVDRIVKMG